MTEVNAFLCCLWFVIAFTEVACWTVDLDEVRQFLDKQREQEDYHQLHYHNYYDESEEYDSFAEVTAQRGQNYAQQYGYEGYMEKKRGRQSISDLWPGNTCRYVNEPNATGSLG
ncbi:hypothetical protein RR46_01220 [Papilio xuthus]|uniref:Uncharacterized protein n=1 Tax=Papilio xuthus TaxID=66420 RepID=A0A0N1PHC4_PAPXU|nr:hypothetical protein RR46_01220 [Papilio xuthus]